MAFAMSYRLARSRGATTSLTSLARHNTSSCTASKGTRITARSHVRHQQKLFPVAGLHSSCRANQASVPGAAAGTASPDGTSGGTGGGGGGGTRMIGIALFSSLVCMFPLRCVSSAIPHYHSVGDSLNVPIRVSSDTFGARPAGVSHLDSPLLHTTMFDLSIGVPHLIVNNRIHPFVWMYYTR